MPISMTRKEFYSYLESHYDPNYGQGDKVKHTFFHIELNGVLIKGYIFYDIIQIQTKYKTRNNGIYVNILRMQKDSNEVIKAKVFNIIDTIWFYESELNIPMDKE